MISQGQFNRAMQEINESYAKLVRRIEALDARIVELEREPEPAPKKAKPKKKESKDDSQEG